MGCVRYCSYPRIRSLRSMGASSLFLALSALWIGPFVSGVKIALARLGDRAHRSRTRIRVTSNGKYSCVRIWHGFTFQRLDPARAAHLLDTRHHGALSPRAARHHRLLDAAFPLCRSPRRTPWRGKRSPGRSPLALRSWSVRGVRQRFRQPRLLKVCRTRGLRESGQRPA